MNRWLEFLRLRLERYIMSIKITNRPEVTTPNDADIIGIVTDPAATRVDKKITVANLRGAITGSDVAVDDAGTPVTTAVTKLNFTGAGVAITEPVANEITVDISAGAGDALKADKLDQFAVTTSTELATVVTDATGTGAFVRAVNAVIGLANGTQLPLSTGVIGQLPLTNLQSASAPSRLLGRRSASAGSFEEITVGSGLLMSGSTIAATGVGLGVSYYLNAITDGGLETRNSGDGDYLARAAINWTQFKLLCASAQSQGKGIFFPGGNYPFSGFTNDGNGGMGDSISLTAPLVIIGSGVGITSFESAVPAEHAIYFTLGASGSHFHLNGISFKVNQPTLPSQDVIDAAISVAPTNPPSFYDASLSDVAVQYLAIKYKNSWIYEWDGASAWTLYRGVQQVLITGYQTESAEVTFIDIHDFDCDGVSVINSANNRDAEEIRIYNGTVKDYQATCISAYMDTGTEDDPKDDTIGDLRRKHLIVYNLDIQSNRSSHHIYVHPQVVTHIHSCRLEGAVDAAIQFENGSGIDGGQHLITSCFFRDNTRHIIGTASDGIDRARLQVIDCVFAGDGALFIRGSSTIKNNKFYITSLETIGFGVGMNGFSDVIIDGNLFEYWGGIIAPILELRNNQAGTCVVSNNYFKSKRGVTPAAMYWIAAGADPATSPRMNWIIENNVFDCIDFTDISTGVFLQDGDYIIRGNKFSGGLVSGAGWIGMSGTGTVVIDDNTFDASVGVLEVNRIAILINDGWSVSGRGNDFRGGAWIKNNTGSIRGIGLRNGHGGKIASAATMYLDPSFDEFTITGTTGITTLRFGASTSRAAPAVGNESINTTAAVAGILDNYNTCFVGDVVLYSLDGVSVGGLVGPAVVLTAGESVRLRATRAGFNALI